MSGYGFAVGSSGYDDEDCLVNWERSDTNLDQSWNLSTVGDWTSITENARTQNRTHGPTHELLTVATQSVTHDAKGNMTLIRAVLRPGSDPLTMKWDFENKLIAADTDDDSIDDIFYKFDALSRRVGRDDGTANVVYFQDGQQTIADYPSGTAATTPTYTYASYIDEPVMRGGSGGLRYYHRNQQYSITAVSDGGGSVVERHAYSAYGQVTIADATGSQILNSGISNRYTYTGREWDEGLSLYHYRARMYDAVGGRFASRDPIGYESLDTFLYRYVSGRPLVTTDPSGIAHPGLIAFHVINATMGCGSCAGYFLADAFACDNEFAPGVPPDDYVDRMARCIARSLGRKPLHQRASLACACVGCAYSSYKIAQATIDKVKNMRPSPGGGPDGGGDGAGGGPPQDGFPDDGPPKVNDPDTDYKNPRGQDPRDFIPGLGGRPTPFVPTPGMPEPPPVPPRHGGGVPR